jgi:hypothetical protein
VPPGKIEERVTMANSAEFKLSVTRALADQMASALGSLAPEPLTREALAALAQRPGVYQLYHESTLVYVGKADRSLPQRLERHRFKLGGRTNVKLADVTFTCLYVDEDLDALAPEKMLIGRFKSEGSAPWNFNGFGNNDPGRERDTTRFKDDHFDVQYPANLNVAVEGVEPGRYKISDLVVKMKAALPYVFRYASTGKKPHRDLTSAQVEVSPERVPASADYLFATIAEAMPAWQITALPGYVIMYPESRTYPSARRVYRRGQLDTG